MINLNTCRNTLQREHNQVYPWHCYKGWGILRIQGHKFQKNQKKNNNPNCQLFHVQFMYNFRISVSLSRIFIESIVIKECRSDSSPIQILYLCSCITEFIMHLFPRATCNPQCMIHSIH